MSFLSSNHNRENLLLHNERTNSFCYLGVGEITPEFFSEDFSHPEIFRGGPDLFRAVYHTLTHIPINHIRPNPSVNTMMNPAHK